MAQSAAVTQLKPAAFVIERGIPIPFDAAIRNGPAETPLTRAIRALAEGEIGASFYSPEASAVKRSSIRVAANRIGGPGWYAVRASEGGTRVWKVSEPNPAKARKR